MVLTQIQLPEFFLGLGRVWELHEIHRLKMWLTEKTGLTWQFLSVDLVKESTVMSPVIGSGS